MGPSEAGWVRLLHCGLPLGPDEFPRPWACGQARPGQGGCLPDILSLWIHQRRQLGKLGAPTCLLAQKASARRGPRSPITKALAPQPQPGQAPRSAGVVGKGAGWGTSQGLRPEGTRQRDLGQDFSSGFLAKGREGGMKALEVPPSPLLILAV